VICLKTVSQSKIPKTKTVISIIVVNESFPSDNFDKLLNSTARIEQKFEVILVTHSIKNGTNIESNLSLLINQSFNLVKISLILTDPDKDKGPAYRRNIGAALANSDNLLFADDDAVVAEDLSPLLKYLRIEGCAGVQPLLLKLADNNIIDSAGDFVRKSRAGFYHPFPRAAGEKIQNLHFDLRVEEAPSMRSAFMIVRKEAFSAVGGFDETFNYNLEDVDLGWRLTTAGYKLFFVPSVKAFHKGGKTTDPAMYYDKTYKLFIINFHALQLKIAGNLFWPFIFGRFLIKSLIQEISDVLNRGVGIVTATRDLITIYVSFLERFKQALIHRRLLYEEFNFRGRGKLEDMAKGKRFILSHAD